MAEGHAPDARTAPATADYDFASNWGRVADWESIGIEAGVLSVSTCRLVQVTVVNGDLRAALDAAAIGSSPVGWPEVASGASYAVRLARDRALVVGGAVLTPGWHAQGFAVSRSDDAGIVFSMSGPGLEELLSLGAAIALHRPSASAVRLFAGVPVILYRQGHENSVRLHIARPRAAALLEWLTLSVRHVQGIAPSR